jgi:hypothetical protein
MAKTENGQDSMVEKKKAGMKKRMLVLMGKPQFSEARGCAGRL